MSKAWFLVLFVFVFLGFSPAKFADEKNVLPKQFASMEELQAFFNYNAHFDNEHLIAVSRAIRNKQAFWNYHSDVLKEQDWQGKYDLKTNTCSSFDRFQNLGSISSGPKVLTINGAPYMAFYRSKIQTGINVTPIVDAQFVVSIPPGQSTTTTTTIQTSDTIKWSMNYGFSIGITDDIKLSFGASADQTTVVTTTIVTGTTYNFPDYCKGYNSASIYVGTCCDSYLVTFEVAPITNWSIPYPSVFCQTHACLYPTPVYDWNNRTTVQIEILWPHAQYWTVCNQI